MIEVHLLVEEYIECFVAVEGGPESMNTGLDPSLGSASLGSFRKLPLQSQTAWQSQSFHFASIRQ